MKAFLTCLALVFWLTTATVGYADTIAGSYVEARSTPQFSAASDQAGLRFSQAILAWQIREGTYEGVTLDGQTIVACFAAEPSTGSSIGNTKTVFLVDGRATAAQQRALVRLAKDLAPAIIHDPGALVTSKIDVRIAEGCGCGAAVVETSVAKVRTRRMTDTDQPSIGEANNCKPLGDAFTSNQAIATEFSGLIGAADSPTSGVLAFIGSFSK